MIAFPFAAPPTLSQGGSGEVRFNIQILFQMLPGNSCCASIVER